MTESNVTHDTFVITRTYESSLDSVFRAWSEPKLIQLAYAFEQATKARKVPPLK